MDELSRDAERRYLSIDQGSLVGDGGVTQRTERDDHGSPTHRVVNDLVPGHDRKRIGACITDELEGDDGFGRSDPLHIRRVLEHGGVEGGDAVLRDDVGDVGGVEVVVEGLGTGSPSYRRWHLLLLLVVSQQDVTDGKDGKQQHPRNSHKDDGRASYLFPAVTPGARFHGPSPLQLPQGVLQAADEGRIWIDEVSERRDGDAFLHRQDEQPQHLPGGRPHRRGADQHPRIRVRDEL